jgi:hypothetical protein
MIEEGLVEAQSSKYWVARASLSYNKCTVQFNEKEKSRREGQPARGVFKVLGAGPITNGGL